MTRTWAVAITVAVACAASACAGDRPVLTDEPPPDANDGGTVTTTAAPAASTNAQQDGSVAAPNGRSYPTLPADDEIGPRLATLERLLRSTGPDNPRFADLAHEQQMIYRQLGRDPDQLPAVLDSVPRELTPTVEAHVKARVAVGGIGTGDPPVNVPAWEIIAPVPADELRDIYERAEAASGIGWAYLAAINLLETGYGRIDGLSTAGARGPMQFLPSTWEEVGEGSIDDPADAIPAAARYLVRRGGPADMEAALWGYNNSDAYVEAVSTYAELFRTDEATFIQTHAWEIHYSAEIGDLWFPVGYRRVEPLPVTDHVIDAPWALPPDAADAP